MAGIRSTAEGLQRFVQAQEPVYASVRAELAAGHKTSHWMWFVFPQLEGLGRSAMARHYGIASKAEAVAYLRHPVLGQRLRECTELVLGAGSTSAYEIFGTPDDLKFLSCMTLFRAVDAEEDLFRQAILRFFDGSPDERTLDLLGSDSSRAC